MAAVIGVLLVGITPFAIKWYLYRDCLARAEKLGAEAGQLTELPAELVPARESVQALVDFHRHALPRYYASWHAWLFRTARRMLARAEKDLSLLRSGKDPLEGRRGTILKVYRSGLDGGAEPYFVNVPHSYDPSKKWPLVVRLHGLVGLGEPFQMSIPDHREDCITLAPHAKGSIDFKWVAEEEVLRAIGEVERAYSIDPDRVYLQGHSMGATGSWSLAVHYPDRFAAISATAGNTDHTVWEELWERPEAPPTSPLLELRKFLEDADSAISFAANLLNGGLYCAHGAADEIVPVQHSRNMVDRLKQEGVPVEYREVPLAPHASEFLTSTSQQIGWLLGRKRPPAPEQVHLKASRLRFAKSHWVEILRPGSPLEFAEVRAELRPMAPATDEDREVAASLTVETQNVAEFSLSPPPALLSGRRAGEPPSEGSAPTRPSDLIKLTVDGQQLHVAKAGPQEGSIVLIRRGDGWGVGERAEGMRKRPGLEGPIEDAMRSRFIVVYGAQGEDDLENEIVRREALALQEQWRIRFGYPCMLKADAEVTENDIQDANLICYGRPDQNSVVARAAPGLPFRFETSRINLGEEVFDAPDAGVKFCYPNPLRPGRYLVVFAANTWHGMFQMNNRFGNWFDWSAYENRNYFDYAVFDARTSSPETFLALGYFDYDWKFSPSYCFKGSPELRAETVPFVTPETIALPEEEPSVCLSDVLPAKVTQLLGAVHINRGFAGNPLAIGDTTFGKGLGVKAPCDIEYDLRGRFRTFTARVGVDTEGRDVTANHREHNNIIFEVLGDGRLLATSGGLKCGGRPHRLECDVSGVGKLQLRARQLGGYRWFLLSATWAKPTVRE